MWKEIDRRMPNPMKHDDDITIFNSFIQRQRLYQFLAGINDTRRDLLNQDPLPTVEKAYAAIRREINRRGIITDASSLGTSPSEIGSGLMVKNRSDYSSFWRDKVDKSHLRCDHCGISRHTKEGCFKRIGYPNRWENLKQRKVAVNALVTQVGGKAQLVTTVPPLAATPQPEETHEETGQGTLS